jgi:hypothetical protein
MPRVDVVWNNGVVEEFDAKELSKESYGFILRIDLKDRVVRVPMLNVMKYEVF